jgi:ankyrin repeat protein
VENFIVRNAGPWSETLMAAKQKIHVLFQTLIDAIHAHDLAGMEQILITCDAPEKLLNETDDRGFTPLIQAIREGQLAMVERILAAGADPNSGPRANETPLAYSIILREYEIAARIIAAGGLDLQVAGFAAAVEAVLGGDTEGVQFLVDNGLDLQQQLPENASLPPAVNQATALIFLAIRYAKHRPVLIKLLTDQGADLDASSAGGGTILGELCNQINEYPAALSVLLDAEASMNQLDSAGYAPLHYAAAHDHYESCQLLLEQGADADQMAKDGTFPLLWASANDGGKVHALLLNNAVSSVHPSASMLQQLSPGWEWSPAGTSWGAFSLAAADGAWNGVAWASSEAELHEQLNLRYGSARGLQPPLLIVRLVRPTSQPSAPFPWRLPGEEIDVEVGQRFGLIFIAPQHAQGITQQQPKAEIYKFAITATSEVSGPDPAPACVHPIEVVGIVAYCEGFIETLDSIKCRYDGQVWALSQ